MPFTVAILGRPNVGKSSLFNRLVGRREALVDAAPGVSRDWREGEANLGGLRFHILDTPGLEEAASDSLEALMSQSARHAAARADLCLFLVDARAGALPEEFHFVARLRKERRAILLVANKCEGGIDAASIPGIWHFGLGAALPISAAHGEGLSFLYDSIAEHIAESGEAQTRTRQEAQGEQEEEEKRGGEGAGERKEGEEGEAGGEKPLALAVIGRPNVGKSSLVNCLLGEARMLTGAQPGITRDAISVSWQWRGRSMRLVDTAGMRRPSRIDARLERLAVSNGLRALRRAEVVVLLLDGLRGFDRQDARLANRVIEAGRALVVGVNKMDAVERPKLLLREIQERFEESLPQVSGTILQGVSAHKGTGIDALMERVFAMHDVWRARIPTARLNQWLQQAIQSHPPLGQGTARLRLRYATQVATCPPSFALFCNRDSMPDSYRRYLVNEARNAFGLQGVPMRWHVRVGKNPYAPASPAR